MVKFKKLWLFERSEFQRFLNFIIVQFIAEIRPGSEIIYMNIYILKTLKFYFCDTRLALGVSGFKLQNLVACTLQKEIHFFEDYYGKKKYLYYLKNKDDKKIDFCIANNQNSELLVEVKLSDENVSSNFNIFQKYFPKVKMTQVVKNLKREKTFPNGVEGRSAWRWLLKLSL